MSERIFAHIVEVEVILTFLFSHGLQKNRVVRKSEKTKPHVLFFSASVYERTSAFALS